jgi:hypothetical protein
MTNQLSRTSPNWITFPQKLRDAIPEFEPCAGRVLKLESVDTGMTDSEWLGRRVAIKLQVCETGKLAGVFEIQLDLNISAAQALAEVLQTAAQHAKTEQPKR